MAVNPFSAPSSHAKFLSEFAFKTLLFILCKARLSQAFLFALLVASHLITLKNILKSVHWSWQFCNLHA